MYMFNQQLVKAARHANLEKIRELIYNCDFANFKSTSYRGRTVLHLVAEKGHLDMVKCLVDKKKADFNIKDDDGRTPLHFAASKGYLEIVQYLIDKKKADFTVKSNFGKTPLYEAISGELNIIEYLIECLEKVNPSKLNKFINAKAKNDMTPFHCDTENGKLDVVKCLVKKV